MNEVKLIKVYGKGDMWSLKVAVDEELSNYGEDIYKLISIQIVGDEIAYVTLQSKY